MNNLINKTVEDDNYIEYNFEELFIEKLEILFLNISVKRSHVLLTSKGDSDSLIAVNKVKYKDKTHISSQHYFDKLTGCVYRKDMNKFVAKTFEQMYV